MAATLRNPILGHLNEGVNKHDSEIKPIIARALWEVNEEARKRRNSVPASTKYNYKSQKKVANRPH